jgi:hypothetical protein
VNTRAKLFVALLCVGVGVCVVMATGFGADPSRRKQPTNADVPDEHGKTLADVATPAEQRLWSARGCVTCHGATARGTPMGPDLGKVVPLYVAKFGGVDAAKTQIVEYLLDPQGSPKLRDDGLLFPNPMPAITKLFGGTEKDAATLADMLLRLAR